MRIGKKKVADRLQNGSKKNDLSRYLFILSRVTIILWRQYGYRKGFDKCFAASLVGSMAGESPISVEKYTIPRIVPCLAESPPGSLATQEPIHSDGGGRHRDYRGPTPGTHKGPSTQHRHPVPLHVR